MKTTSRQADEILARATAWLEGDCNAVAHTSVEQVPALVADLKEAMERLKELREWHKCEYQSNQWIDARVDAALASWDSVEVSVAEVGV